MKNIIFITLFLCIAMPCEAKHNLVIDVSKTLDSLEKKQLLVTQLQFDLPSIISIDYSLKKRVDRIDSSYLSENIDYEASWAIGTERYKDTVQLVKRYLNVEEVIVQEDDSLRSYFADQGVNIFYPFYPMLKYKNKIRISGYHYAFIVTLLKPKVVTVELVYLIFD